MLWFSFLVGAQTSTLFRVYSEGGTQTSEVVVDHKETQSYASADAQCQTDEVIPDEIVIEDDSPELLSFLLYVEEDVTAQLVRNAQSHAFDGTLPCRAWRCNASLTRCKARFGFFFFFSLFIE